MWEEGARIILGEIFEDVERILLSQDRVEW
jgi:hypothetical protein